MSDANTIAAMYKLLDMTVKSHLYQNLDETLQREIPIVISDRVKIIEMKVITKAGSQTKPTWERATKIYYHLMLQLSKMMPQTAVQIPL